MENKYKELGHKLVELRKKKGIKQGELAELTTVNPNSLSAFEKRGEKIRSFDVIEALFNAVGYEFDLTPKKKPSRSKLSATPSTI